jgi:hypothetical protein
VASPTVDDPDGADGTAFKAPFGAPAIGDRVEHDRFGRGRVVASDEGTAETILTIRFDSEPTPREIAASTRMLRVLSVWDEGRVSPPWTEIDDPARFVPP